MMRYSIYEGERDFVSLKEEVDYLQNYIELHKMRYHKEIDVQFDVQIVDEYKVMPLLFIILLENAFKHGVSLVDGHSEIHLEAKLKGEKLFICLKILNIFIVLRSINQEV